MGNLFAFDFRDFAGIKNFDGILVD